jgi:BirA family transcriptional regulator, biotin operon repressor / biotin---[acetyl-CoA-carboxylase] ligase
LLTGSNLIELGSIPSTNDYAILLCDRNKVKEGTIIWTSQQTGGRGQRGNSWEVGPHEGLCFSIVYYPSTLSLEKLNFLSIMAALSARKFIEKLLPQVTVKIKWPNDILVDDKKIGGILVENSIQGNRIQRSIMGIGINVNQEKFPESLPGAVSLFHLTGMKKEIKSLIAPLLFDIFDQKYNSLKAGDFQSLMQEYQNNLWGLGMKKKFNHPSGSLWADLLGANEDGSLLVEVNGEMLRWYWPEYRIEPKP